MPSLSWLILISSLISTLAGAALPQPPAQGTTTVTLAPTSLTVTVGQTIDVAVGVEDVADLYAFDLALTYDPAVVEVVDADPDQPGTQVALGVFLDPGFVLRNTADNAAGTLAFALTQLNPSTAKSGTGHLIVIRLRGRQVSAGAPLTLTRADLARRDGTLIATSLVAGQIVVVATSAGPTATAIATQPAGTPLATSTEAGPAGSPTTGSPAIASPTGPAGTATPAPAEATTPAASATVTAPAATPTGPAAASPTPAGDPATATPESAVVPASATPAPTTPATPLALAAAPSPFPTFIPTLPPPAPASNPVTLPAFIVVGGLGLLGIVGLTAWGLTRRAG